MRTAALSIAMWHRRSWILEEASARRASRAAAATAAAEEADSPARVTSPTSPARGISLQTPFEPGDKFFAAAKALWADAAVRECFDKMNPGAFDKVTEAQRTLGVTNAALLSLQRKMGLIIEGLQYIE